LKIIFKWNETGFDQRLLKGDQDISKFSLLEPSVGLRESPSPSNIEPLFSPQKHQDPLAVVTLNVTDFLTKILVTHPCTVLRRQCQVHQFAMSLHLTPFTLIPIIYKVVSSEGLRTLWKGAIGSSVLWSLSSLAEIVIADIFGFPRTYVKRGSTEKFLRHVALKTIISFSSTAIALTPFIVSSFIETIKSESGMGDEIRFMDVITNGINRLRFDFIGPKDNSKRFSLLYLSLPTACYVTSHYLITTGIHDSIYVLAKRYVNRKPLHEKSIFHHYFPEIFAILTSQMLADLALYPLETIIHRLYVQGTRTLIDNLDNGVTAISITAKYSGFFDCLNAVTSREGFWSLYAGIGALGLQYILHLCLLRFIRSAFEYSSRGISAQRKGDIDLDKSSSNRFTPLNFDPPFPT
uniref:Solute carrier family 25 member 46 n=1 Tax=Thelazia callipaeda TaxID=103827 RepID=A0A0N5CUB3_THECL